MIQARCAVCFECGNSSVVEHHLAKVGVASSSLVFRSIHNKYNIDCESSQQFLKQKIIESQQVLRYMKFHA